MNDLNMIQPIKRKENMANLVAKQLIDLIVSGTFPTGERLLRKKTSAKCLQWGATPCVRRPAR